MIDAQAGRQLLGVARSTLAQFLTCGEKYLVDQSALPPSLIRQVSSFVTLYNGHYKEEIDRLRGCIGSTHALIPLVHDVMRNTIAAARDPRFRPVTAIELPDLTIQISILHPPRCLDYVDYSDLLDRLRPDVDGVIISWQEQKALLLPQVWRRLSDPDTFMRALCYKACIPLQEVNQSPHRVKILTFETTSFSETERAPSGHDSDAVSGSAL